MSNEDSTAERVTSEASRPRTTFAVQFVFEVEQRADAETIRAYLPHPDVPGVSRTGYRSYVESAGLRLPTTGGSVPYYDRRDAEQLYETLAETDDVDDSVAAGTLALRRFDGGTALDEEPVVVAATEFP
ncbi:hypothetical protein [Halorussus sp. MSC15.2]|uniref:hypothetical protein n=1 Tax=Halorussus sp. MSC15.2 TaxID=2283638 RepID=UPI0013D4F41C|nr:hypothetical protein [Halorussus sp. MSC15.2]NEU57114.1 hypothetical protein [Halorussus sp. MSC15.2]